jgi:DNA-binding MarR family transcriptional regulator
VQAITDVEDGAAGASVGAAQPSTLAADLYAVVVYLHKNCNSDLFAAVGSLELTLTQIKLLHHLEEPDAVLTVKEAAELVSVSLPAASRTVDDLVRRGFVERHEDPDDRRMKRVSPTEAGRAVVRRLNAARLSGLEQFAETLNETERRDLAGALQTLLERPDVAACRMEEGRANPDPVTATGRSSRNQIAGLDAPRT